MSRIDELKKQYPELNITMFDILTKMDTSKTYKYMPLLCKFFGERFNVTKQWDVSSKGRLREAEFDLKESLSRKGISVSNETISQLYTYREFTEFYNLEMFETIKEFMDRMDKNQIPNKDVTSYPTLDSLRAAVSLAYLKESEKELESQVIREYEDEKWLIIRPLTFQASSKYGASTRWCTTYQKEKQYFERYWRRGILVYFINKLTGYKFAGFKALDGDTELSFWNSADNRVDYLDVEADDYLFPIVRRILNSKDTNKDLCSLEIIKSVEKECQVVELKSHYEAEEAPLRRIINGGEAPMITREEPSEYIGRELSIREIEVQAERVMVEREWTYDEGPMQAG